MADRTPKPLPSSERLRELFRYDPETGWLIRRVARPHQPVGARAGSVGPGGYRRLSIDGVEYYEHRVIWKMVHGADPVAEIDHEHRNRADNRAVGLREANSTQNKGNSQYSTSTVRGVRFRPHLKSKPYEAYLTIKGRFKFLGMHASESEALHAYNVAARAHFGAQFAPS